MSQQNVELVRSVFDTFGNEGLEAALPFFAPDMVWYTTDRWLEGSAYRGHDGLRLLNRGFSENFDDWGYEIQDVGDADDHVVALVRMYGHIKNTQQSVSQPLGLLVSDFRGGTFASIRAFPSWEEALKAVALKE